MFKKLKSTLACLLVATFAVALLAGCEGDSSRSSNDPSTDTIRDPRGTVMGKVEDTNGNPIAGATVTLGSKTATTNAGGQYEFRNVPAINAVGADGTIVGNPLAITIVPPAGFLGATVTVYPQAQFDGTTYPGTGVVAPGNTGITFVDGFVASAGKAVLPKLDSRVTGTLRNCTTGAPIGNQQISLDMLGTAEFLVAQEQEQDWVTTGYQTLAYATVTAADGSFTIAGVPDDTILNVVVGNHNIDREVNTSDETDVVNINPICATPITSSDSTAPFITRVNNVIGTALCVDNQCAERATLRRGVDGTTGVVVTFSEPMAPITQDDVFVRNVTTGTYITGFTLSQSGNQLTITFATALPEGTRFDIIFDRGEVTDLAGNMLVDTGAVTFDFFFGTDTAGGACQGAACGTPFVKVCLRIFPEINLATGEVALEQVCDVAGAPATPIDQDLHDLYSTVFVDVECVGPNCGVGFQQLNFQDGGVIGEDPQTVLTDLSAAFGGSVVEGGVALVTFTPLDGVDAYTVGGPGQFHIDNNCGAGATACCDTFVLGTDGLPVDTGFCVDGTVFVADTTPVELVFHGVRVGNAVTVTPLDDLGNTGTTSNLVLADCVEPTVVLQQAYGVCNTEGGTGGLPNYGSGAELADEGVDATLGVVLYPVTPRMLGRQELDPFIGTVTLTPATPPAAPSLDEPIAIWNLYGGNVVNTTPNPDVTFLSAFGLADIYDATSFNAFTGTTGRRVGLAVSENLSSVSAATFTNGTAVLSDFALLNNVVNNDDTFGVVNEGTNNPPADLVLFNVNSVLTLANVDHGKFIDMTGAMTDTNNLVASAGANAKAKVQDRMPPFVDRAYFGAPVDGVNALVIDFNEAIALPVAPNNFVTLVEPGNPANTCDIFLTGTGALAPTLTNGATTLRIPFNATAWCANFAAGTFFPSVGPFAAVYDETSYADLVDPDTLDLPHGILNIDRIPDLRSNRWINWNGVDPANCFIPDGMVDTPVFAAVDVSVVTELQGGVNSAPENPVTTNTAGNVTVIWTFTQPIDWAIMYGLDYNSTTGAIANAANYFGLYATVDDNVAVVAPLLSPTSATVVSPTVVQVVFNVGTPSTLAAGNAFKARNTSAPGPLSTPVAPAGLDDPSTPYVWSLEWKIADLTQTGAAGDLEKVRDTYDPLVVQAGTAPL